MKNRKVKAMMVKAGLSQKQVAEDLGLSRSNVSCVINGHYESKKVKEYIAQKLGRPYEKVWGKGGKV